MAVELKPYPGYTDSRVEWLGSVPAHWKVLKLRRVLRSHTERERSDLPLLSVVRERGVILRDTTSSDENHNYIPDDLSNYKVVRVGQFVMNKMKAWQGSYGVSRHDGIVSPAYFIFDVFGLRSDFFHAAIRSRAYVPAFTRASDGVRVGQWDLAEARMRDVQFLVPPAFEQAAIVRFLDYVDRRIRRSIRAKEKLIALLQEQKQAIIHEAVTGRIDVRTGRPYPDYKESGVEWLGAVPAHWDVQRSKRVFRPRTELAHPGDTQLSATQAYGVIAQADYEEKIGRKVTKILRHLDQRRHVEIDDFVISMRSFQGGLERAWTSGCIRSSYIVLRAVTALTVGYFGHLFKSAGYIAALQSTANFIRDGQDLNFENFCRIDVPFPPIEEQQQIAHAVGRGTDRIASSIERLRRQIGSLREYRARLIADVVTGKLDVRESVAGLPELDPGAAEEDTDDNFNRHLGSEAGEDAEEGGPLRDIVNAEGAEAEAGESMAEGR